MRRLSMVLRRWPSSLLFLFIGFNATLAAENQSVEDRETTTKDDTAALATKIDELVSRRWAELKVVPAPAAEDAEFSRRVYLDIAGRVPSVAEARAFLADKRSDKRRQLVEQLLASPRYVVHLTNVWRALLIPEAGNNFQVRLQQGAFEAWLKQRIARNISYDQLARDLVTAPLGQGGGGFALAGLRDSGPVTYYLAKEFRPENLAASTARVFLGVSVECAQCHNHPFADWKQEQFWGMAAFYSGIQSQRLMDFLVPGREDAGKHELTIPGTEKVVQAKFLDGSGPAWKSQARARDTLAQWLTSPSNPYFARAAVNRFWAYFLGTGLIEPVDEMVGASSTASHPELLDLLAREFANHKFDVKFLIRTIAATQAYQLTSAHRPQPGDDLRRHDAQNEPTVFARMPLRGLTAEQLFDSLIMATGFRDSGGGDDLITGILGGNRSARSEFLTKFARSERAVDAQSSILQALSLMNGKLVANATSLEHSETLAAIVDAPFMDTHKRVEALYLATLSRVPEQQELARAVRFVDEAVKASGQGGKGKHAQSVAYNNALADVFWALLNGPEFILNH